ncbi:MAG: A/G-specific adenine glycosylase [Ignavibacteriae bacterium]|nr:A/G-specific adenine glycosylase [Ignavibacteriota bacterium]
MKSKDIQNFQNTVLDWYKHNKREFLWRRETPEPFLTLVSEVMLQQTQTSRVAEKLPVFFEQFPTIFALAEASNADIIRAWKGMGYNNRALRLRDAARLIGERYNGQIPQSLDELLALPGIGRYTATALMSFSFKIDIAVVDVNIRRVYSRIFFKMETTASVAPEKEINEIADMIYPKNQSSEWHQAIMDIGALYCTARQPECKKCPLQIFCISAGAMIEYTSPKRAEPSYNGIPRRIWRGRTVELLRSASILTSESINHFLFGEFATQDDHKWIRQVLLTLEKDGIILQNENVVQLREN